MIHFLISLLSLCTERAGTLQRNLFIILRCYCAEDFSIISHGVRVSQATKQVVLETSARRNVVYPLALGISQKRKS